MTPIAADGNSSLALPVVDAALDQHALRNRIADVIASPWVIERDGECARFHGNQGSRPWRPSP